MTTTIATPTVTPSLPDGGSLASRPYNVAVLIGRLQFFHNGHAQLLNTALSAASKVIVVLGSAVRGRSAKNPFTAEERAAMIWVSLSPADQARVTFVPMRDYYNDDKWAAAVRAAVSAQTESTDTVALVRHQKDESGYYLDSFPEWAPLAVTPAWAVDATGLRAALFEANDLEVAITAMAGQAPAATLQYVKAWARLGHWPRLSAEHAAVQSYRKVWQAAPYPPTFITTDAVVRAGDHVLLIRRQGDIGDGLLALPGGFLEQDERLLEGTLRELTEETCIAETRGGLRDALREVTVFDHPGRSQRGRTITHAHYFVLPPGRQPDVKANSDAGEVHWVPVQELAALEDQFFEDHFTILGHFLGLGCYSAG